MTQYSSTESGHAAAPETEALATGARDAGKRVSSLRRIANWFRAVHAAHEARMIELRVYGRDRD